MYDASCDQEIDSSEPPNPDRDKFKVPKPKRLSAFAPVIPRSGPDPEPTYDPDKGAQPNAYNRANDDIVRNSFEQSGLNNSSWQNVTNSSWKYLHSRGPTLYSSDSTSQIGSAKVVSLETLLSSHLQHHPVIVELVKQAREKKFSKCSFYIPIDFINNYQYCHNEKIPILYDSREKWSSIKYLDLPSEYYMPDINDDSSESTKSISDDKIIGKYTMRERRERISKYKLKLQKYRKGLTKTMKKYQKRSIIAKCKPRVRGKFAKAGDAKEAVSASCQNSAMPDSQQIPIKFIMRIAEATSL